MKANLAQYEGSYIGCALARNQAIRGNSDSMPAEIATMDRLVDDDGALLVSVGEIVVARAHVVE